MANKIQFKRGVKANLPTLNVAEPAFTTDTNQFYVGNGTTNIELGKKAEIGDLTTLSTTAKSTVVAAINEVNAKPSSGGTATATTYSNTTSGLVATNVQVAVDELDTNIGDLSTLNTTSNTDLVGAINEVDSDIGDKTLLQTTDKSSVVNAINENTLQLAAIATYIDADRTGVLSASVAINNLIASSSDGDEIHFHDGTYLIDTPIIWNKKVTLIADGRVTLKASTTIDAIIIASGFTTYTDVHLDGFFLDGDSKSDYCIKIDGSALYAVKTVIENCECRNAVLDGIIIIPPAWTITIKNTLSNSNGRDGLRSIMTSVPGTNSLNHIKIEGCTFNDNVGDGINILGVINTIINCDIENNNMGIRIDATQCADSYASFHLNANENYIEGNKTNQIYAFTNTGDGIILNVKGNYFNTANVVGSEAIIKCAGISEGITLNLGENRFESSNVNVILDGGDCLNTSSLITSDVYLNESKFVNLGYARIENDNYSFINLSAINSTAFSGDVYTTSDIVLKSPKKVTFTVPINMQFRMPKYIRAVLTTNATSYDMNCLFEVHDKTGTVVSTGTIPITGTTTQIFEYFITNIWGNLRIPKEHILLISFEINSITPDCYLTVGKVFLNYI
jgi:hypothetical protein